MMDPYEPHLLPIESISWEERGREIRHSYRALSNYDGKLSGIINQDLLLSPLTTRQLFYPHQHNDRILWPLLSKT